MDFEKTARVYRGDTWQRAWLMRDADGQPVVLTGAVARLQVRGAGGAVALDATPYMAVDGEPGRVDMVVPYAAMEALVPGRYVFDMEVTFASGVRRTYEQATLVVVEDVTRDG